MGFISLKVNFLKSKCDICIATTGHAVKQGVIQQWTAA